MNNCEVTKLILDCLKDLNEELGLDELSRPSEETKIFGKEGALDSLGIMKLICSIENNVKDSFNKTICITDEKNFTCRNSSPFRSVKDMSEFVNELIASV
ncbi:MAG: hypothetical protein ACYDG2_25390 [Ruminiclostridium sp.]